MTRNAQKRKATSQYPHRSTKRAKRTTVSVRRPALGTYKKTFSKRAKSVYTRPKKRVRFAKGKSFNSRATKCELMKNTLTLVDTIADRIQVPQTTTGLGKQCAYIFAGVSQGGGTLYRGPLKNIYHFQQMATSIEPVSGTSFSGETQFLDAATTIPLVQNKFLIKDATQQYELVNCSVGVANITAYKCRVRRDIIYGNTYNGGDWCNGLIGQGLYERGFQSGGIENNNITIHEDSITPYDSPKFCSYIKILKQSTHKLHNGGSIKFEIKHKRPQMINMNHYFTAQNTSDTFLTRAPDYSHRAGEEFYLFKFSGQAANDSTTLTDITSTRPALDLITKTHYNYCGVNIFNPFLLALTPLGYTTAPVGVEIMNEDTGAVVSDVNA